MPKPIVNADLVKYNPHLAAKVQIECLRRRLAYHRRADETRALISRWCAEVGLPKKKGERHA